MSTRQTVVMVTSSYPRFPGDAVGTFMEPIARGVAARGHEVHLVAPWHPEVRRAAEEDGVRFHFFRYAPSRRLNVFGYAGALRADVRLRGTALLAAPLALTIGWLRARAVARRVGATVMHGHWVIPGGAIALAARGGRPLVVSLHGSDIYVAERHAGPRLAARATLRRAGAIVACSQDLATRAIRLGAPPERIAVVPYGVDAERFRPDPAVRAQCRATLSIADGAPLVVAAGRLVRKKGFEHLIEATARLKATHSGLHVLLAGTGDLEPALRRLAADLGVADTVRFVGVATQPQVAAYLAAADVVVVPSVRDAEGNVDGLPNIVMEALASGTALVTTPVGGIGAVVTDRENARLVPERDPAALAAAVSELLADRSARRRLGETARAMVTADYGWDRVALHYDRVYARLTGEPRGTSTAGVEPGRGSRPSD